MENLFKYVSEQYEAVQGSRSALFEFCSKMSCPDFLNENSNFGRGGSARNLFVHIANVYEIWVAKNALHREIVFTDYQSKQNINEIIVLFEQVDVFMQEFIGQFRLEESRQIPYNPGGKQNSVSLLKIFTHVITHEFHHKGQILSLSRQLGYVPVDTDIIR